MKSKIAVVIIAAICFSWLQHFEVDIKAYSFQNDNPQKRKALEILENKCNACHYLQNPRKVFTYNNMDILAPKIYKQVYVKKRMPKGNPLLLNKEERDVLLNWLKTKVVVEK
jgi:uncharacterized membrane protein